MLVLLCMLCKFILQIMETQASEKANDVHQQRARTSGQRKGRVGRNKVPTDPKLELFLWQGRRLKVRSGATVSSARTLPIPLLYLPYIGTSSLDLDTDEIIDIGGPEPKEQVNPQTTATTATTTISLAAQIKPQPRTTFKVTPKNTVNSFQYFVSDQRRVHPDLRSSNLIQQAATAWKLLGPEQKRPYQEMVKTDKARYTTEKSSIALYGQIL